MAVLSMQTRTTFDPEALSVLGSALDGAWKSLTSGGQLNGDAEAVRTELAKRVIRLATQGERDRQRLIRGALIGFRGASLVVVKEGHHHLPSSVPAV